MNPIPGKAIIIELHAELLACLRGLLSCGEQFESTRLLSAVVLCEEYIARIYALIPPHGLVGLDQEVQFFKYIKPLFTAEREYYQLLYHAHLFGTGMQEFWGEERLRVDTLLAGQWEFAAYYHEGLTYNDYAWFSQGQPQLPCPLCLQLRETNLLYVSARDGWVACLIAMERYRDYLDMMVNATDNKTENKTETKI